MKCDGQVYSTRLIISKTAIGRDKATFKGVLAPSTCQSKTQVPKILRSSKIIMTDLKKTAGKHK